MLSIFNKIRKKFFSKSKKKSHRTKTLEEISLEIISGNEIIEKQLGTGDCPAIRCSDINNSPHQQIYKCSCFVNPDIVKNPKYFEYGDVLMSKQNNKKTTVGKSVIYLNKQKGLAGHHVQIIKTKKHINPKYLNYSLSTKFCRDQIEKLAQKKIVFFLKTDHIKQIKVPIPAIKTQNKTVKLLDKFCDLDLELNKHLENIEKKYEFHKNLIFDVEANKSNWEIKTIKEIAKEVYLGHEITKEQYKNGNYPAIKFCDLTGNNLDICFDKCISFANFDSIKTKKYFEYGDFVIAYLSRSPEKIGTAASYLGKKKCLAGKGIAIVKHNQNPKFIAYAWTTKPVREQIIESYSFRVQKIEQIKIPVPSLKEQVKTVKTLDKIRTDISKVHLDIQKNKEEYNFYKESLISPK